MPVAASNQPIADPQLRKVFVSAADTGDYAAALDTARDRLDGLLAWGDLQRDTESLVEAAWAVKALELFQTASTWPDAPDATPLLGVLLENPKLARELVFLVGPSDTPGTVLAVLDEIIETKGGPGALKPGELDADASLIAALCVVHDRPIVVERNENAVTPEPPGRLYEYFSDNRRRLHIDYRDLPPELLAHVVDTASSIPELEWALNAYRGRPRVGELYFEIDYDYDAFGTREKRLTEMGFNLPNIKRYGGVCVDQAHFASEVGKALGVPTAYAEGRAVVGHAWVGYMRIDRGGARWDFDQGRYEAYQAMVGRITEPRSGQDAEESRIVLLEGLAGVSRQQRHEARALAFASQRFASLRRSGAYPPEAEGRTTRKEARPLGVESELELLRAAIERCPVIAELWDPIIAYAKRDELPESQLRVWGEAVLNLAGSRHPGFAASFLLPLSDKMENGRDRQRVLDHLVRLAGRNRDVVAEVRLHQARQTRKLGDKEKAYEMFTYIAGEFINDAPQALTALNEAEAMLVLAGKEDYAPSLFENVWRKAERPDLFASLSNWSYVGERLAYYLERSGQSSRARAVRMQLTGS